MRSRAFLLVITVSAAALLLAAYETGTGPSNDEGDIKGGIGDGGKYNAYFYPSGFGFGGPGSPPGYARWPRR